MNTNDLFDQVLRACFEVANVLGAGFLEAVYEHALIRELATRGLKVEAQVQFPVDYKGARVGTYYADLVVEGNLIVELKCADSISKEHIAQTLNYLRASGLHLALIANFQRPKLEWKRIIRD